MLLTQSPGRSPALCFSFRPNLNPLAAGIALWRPTRVPPVISSIPSYLLHLSPSCTSFDVMGVLLYQAFGDAWLACLRLPLRPAVYRQVLLFLPGNVIPYMPSPVRLADFLTEAYGLGGVQAVLALDALFLLMQVRPFVDWSICWSISLSIGPCFGRLVC